MTKCESDENINKKKKKKVKMKTNKKEQIQMESNIINWESFIAVMNLCFWTFYRDEKRHFPKRLSLNITKYLINENSEWTIFCLSLLALLLRFFVLVFFFGFYVLMWMNRFTLFYGSHDYYSDHIHFHRSKSSSRFLSYQFVIFVFVVVRVCVGFFFSSFTKC